MVVPPGEQTMSLMAPGCLPLSSIIFAVPMSVCAAISMACARGQAQQHAAVGHGLDEHRRVGGAAAGHGGLGLDQARGQRVDAADGREHAAHEIEFLLA